MQPEVIYAHAHNLTSSFLLKVFLEVRSHAKCSLLIGNRGLWIHFQGQICDWSWINVLTAHAQTLLS